MSKLNLEINTIDSAPEASRPVLESVQKAYGFVPHLLGVLAASPVALETYFTVSGLFGRSDFDATEQHVILQTVNAVNACHYCLPVHARIAQGNGVDVALDTAVRDLRPIEGEPRLEALRAMTEALVRTGGHPDQATIGSFLAAGYGEAQLLEILVGIALKTVSNYANHLARTPVDEAFL
jgi:uncharacterized peroxidase-related enzyme